VDLPDVKDLAGAPTWLAIAFLAVAVLTPILSTLHERRRRRHHHKRDGPDEKPAIERAVDGATEMLDDAIDDLRAQRDRFDADRGRLQRALDKERADSAHKDVTIARLEAQIEIYRTQQGNRGQS
jgi:hypothetical protein